MTVILQPVNQQGGKPKIQASLRWWIFCFPIFLCLLLQLVNHNKYFTHYFLSSFIWSFLVFFIKSSPAKLFTLVPWKHHFINRILTHPFTELQEVRCLTITQQSFHTYICHNALVDCWYHGPFAYTTRMDIWNPVDTATDTWCTHLHNNITLSLCAKCAITWRKKWHRSGNVDSGQLEDEKNRKWESQSSFHPFVSPPPPPVSSLLLGWLGYLYRAESNLSSSCGGLSQSGTAPANPLHYF